MTQLTHPPWDVLSVRLPQNERPADGALDTFMVLFMVLQSLFRGKKYCCCVSKVLLWMRLWYFLWHCNRCFAARNIVVATKECCFMRQVVDISDAYSNACVAQKFLLRNRKASINI